MTTDSITIKMLKTIERGRESLSDEARELIAEFISSQKGENGGFVDKQGREDVYYSSFGWLLQFVFGIENDTKAMEAYLDKVEPAAADVIHYAAYMRCRLIATAQRGYGLGAVMTLFKRHKLRRAEEFDIWPNDDSKSPYSQFIWLSLLEDSNNVELWNDNNSLSEYIALDGGYANLKRQSEGSVNATAAALMVRGAREGFDAKQQGVEYLLKAQTVTGGFKATESTPMPDLLSTATALFTLRCYDVKPHYSTKEFIEAHWLNCGGFTATLLDNSCDVEYLFYGLLALGTL